MTGPDLQAARMGMGLTQGAFASALGAGRRTVQHWESGERDIPELVARVVRLAKSDPTILNRIAEEAEKDNG